MRIVSGQFNGTGAAVYLCIGFIPDYVKIINPEDGITGATLRWYRNMRAAEVTGGILNEADGTAHVAKTAGQAIDPYYGGDILTSSNQTSTTYGEGVYLGWDNRDLKADTDHVASEIDTWMLDTSGSRTGSFNADVKNGLAAVIASGTGSGHIGEGSRITIRETVGQKVKTVFIEDPGNGGQDAGEADDEVTLSEDVKSGTVLRITPAFDLAPIAVGNVTPAGFKLSLTSLVNDNNELQYFEAAKYDY